MTGDELAALCIFSEAQGEMHDGQVAVGRVIRNRMALRYQSDGTVSGTVLHPSAFSGFNHDFVDGKYVLVAHTPEQIADRAADMLTKAKKSNAFAGCVKAWADSATDSGYIGAPALQMLGPHAVLYDNLALARPAWATPDKFVCQIGHHSFYNG